MADYLNAECCICRTKYHLCRTCENIETFSPWRTVTDTREHYKIFLVLSEYNKTKNKEQAKKELASCDLTGMESFSPAIRAVIEEILKEPEKVVKKSAVTKIERNVAANIQLKDKDVQTTKEKNVDKRKDIE